MLSNQIQYHLLQLGKNFKNDPEKTKKEIEQVLQMPFDEIMRQTKKLGEKSITSWLYAKNQLPQNIQDKVLFNNIMEACDTISKELSVAKALLDTLLFYFPNSKYFNTAKTEVSRLQHAYNNSIKNKKIIIHADKKPATMNELIAPYLGKAIYIDIWGTWCGPCKMEMGYVKELKKRFSNKDVIFLYLEMDKDDADSNWKKMVYAFDIEGEHYRLTDKEIVPIWSTIKKAGGEIERYPTFVIINKEGKLVHANAERPSSKEVLYKQLEAIL